NAAAMLEMLGCEFKTDSVDVGHVLANSSAPLALFLIGNRHFCDPNVAYSSPTIHVATASGNNVRATIVGNQTLDKGTGAGTFIQIDADNFHRVGLNAAIGWTTTFPAPTSGIYDDTIVTTNGPQAIKNKTLDNTNAATLKDANFVLQDDSDTTKQ